jgi:hypothetical protein
MVHVARQLKTSIRSRCASQSRNASPEKEGGGRWIRRYADPSTPLNYSERTITLKDCQILGRPRLRLPAALTSGLWLCFMICTRINC